MSETEQPKLIIHASGWSLLHEADPFKDESALRKQLSLVKEAGFESYCGWPGLENLKPLLEEYGLLFGAMFDAASADQFEERIAGALAIGDGPINCQLADHDTPVEEAVELTIALMAEAKKQGARVHLEVHRDTCTETPEKTMGIIEGYEKAVGEPPLVNFDFSHPATIKHLYPDNYIERLLTPEVVPVFQRAQLWHMRPFNGHHCQIPITDGKGEFSPEYAACRPFIRRALELWLEGPRPGNKLWVVPEQGCTGGYDLSCFPNIWNDTVVLGKDIQQMWSELLS